MAQRRQTRTRQGGWGAAAADRPGRPARTALPPASTAAAARPSAPPSSSPAGAGRRRTSSCMPSSPAPARVRRACERRGLFFSNTAEHADGDLKVPLEVRLPETFPTLPSDAMQPLGVRRRRVPKELLKIDVYVRAARCFCAGCVMTEHTHVRDPAQYAARVRPACRTACVRAGGRVSRQSRAHTHPSATHARTSAFAPRRRATSSSVPR